MMGFPNLTVEWQEKAKKGKNRAKMLPSTMSNNSKTKLHTLILITINAKVGVAELLSLTIPVYQCEISVKT